MMKNMVNKIAWERKERFTIISSPMEKDGIISTAVRERFRTGESAQRKSSIRR